MDMTAQVFEAIHERDVEFVIVTKGDVSLDSIEFGRCLWSGREVHCLCF